MLWSEPGAEIGGCQGGPLPPKILPGTPKIRALSESPTQTIDSSPCCKTGPSSGPPNENVCLRPWSQRVFETIVRVPSVSLALVFHHKLLLAIYMTEDT